MSNFEAMRFIDENGVSYGIKHVENKPRVSSTPYLFDISKGAIPGHKSLIKFGMNDNLAGSESIVADLPTFPYPYLTSAESLNIISADAADDGTLLTDITISDGSATTVVRAAGSFVADGVAVGDIVINDTQSTHGMVTAVTALTVTVYRMEDDEVNAAGDAIRVATSASTGAAVMSVSGLDGDYAEQEEYIVLNGTTGVTTTNTFIRVFRAKVYLAGTSLTNEGNITVRNAATTSNLARILAERGQTLMAQFTVPEGKDLYIVEWDFGTDENSKGVEFMFMVRPYLESWQTKYYFHTPGVAKTIDFSVPYHLHSRTDIEIRAIGNPTGSAVNSAFHGWYE